MRRRAAHLAVLVGLLVAIGAAGAAPAGASTACGTGGASTCETITGTVTVPAGFDVTKVRVFLFGRVGSGHADCVQPAPDGTFTLQGTIDRRSRPTNRLYVRAAHSTLWDDAGCAIPAPAGADDQNLVDLPARRVSPGTGVDADLVEGGAIRLALQDATGAAVGATCAVEARPGVPGTLGADGSTDPVTGVVTLERLAPGTASVRVSGCTDGLQDGWLDDVAVSAGETTDAHLRLQPSRSISLRIRDGATAVGGMCVTARRAATSPALPLGADPAFGALPAAVTGTTASAVSAAADPAVPGDDPVTVLSGLRPGRYDVHVATCGDPADVYLDGPNYLAQDLPAVDVTAGDAGASDPLSVPLEAGGSITGTVDWPTGLVEYDGFVNGAAICLTAETDPAVPGGDVVTTTADPEDDTAPFTYAIFGLHTGTYRVTARLCEPSWDPPGAVRKGVAVTAGAATTGIGLTAPKGAVITGTILKPDGSPADVSCVTAVRTSYADAGGSSAWGQNALGEPFTTSRVAAGTFTVSFVDCTGVAHLNDPADTGVLTEPATVTVTAAQVAAGSAVSVGTLRYVQGGAVGGVVYDDQGAELAGVCVSAEATGGAGRAGDYGSAVTDAFGEFTIRGLATGAGTTRSFRLHYRDCAADGPHAPVWLGGSPLRDDSATVTVTRGDIAPADDMVLSPGGSIAGTVAKPDAGGSAVAAAGVCVVAFADSQPTDSAQTPVGSAVTDANGAYLIDRLPIAVDGTLLGYRVYAAPCGLAAADLRGAWFLDGSPTGTQTASAATSIVVGVDQADIDVELAAAADGQACNPMLFTGGSCTAPAAFSAPALPAGGNADAQDVGAPASPAAVYLDPDTGAGAGGLERVTAPTVADRSPLDPATPGAPVGADGAVDALSAYVDVEIERAGQGDTGGGWNPPLRIDIPVSDIAGEDVGSIPDADLSVFFHAAGAWTAIPYIGDRAVPALRFANAPFCTDPAADPSSCPNATTTEQDGYYVTGVGDARVVHILTRHATTFGVFGPRGSGLAIPTKATPPTARAQTLKARPPKRLEHGKARTLATKTDQGQPLTWRSKTTRICTVRRTFTGRGAKRRTIWTLRAGKRRGTCRLTATAPKKGLSKATSFAYAVTIF